MEHPEMDLQAWTLVHGETYLGGRALGCSEPWLGVLGYSWTWWLVQLLQPSI
jgi:hypothetical protein